MAGLEAVVQTNGALAVPSSAKTLLHMNGGTGCGTRIKGVDVSFDGTSTTNAKILVELVKGASSAGTPHATAPITAQIAGVAGTIQATFGQNYTAEPAAGTVVAQMLVHPQGGYAFREEFMLAQGERFGIRCTCSAAVNMRGRIRFEE